MIEAPRTSILVPHDHLHINQMSPLTGLAQLGFRRTSPRPVRSRGTVIYREDDGQGGGQFDE
jgi:hypothetical protein